MRNSKWKPLGSYKEVLIRLKLASVDSIELYVIVFIPGSLMSIKKILDYIISVTCTRDLITAD